MSVGSRPRRPGSCAPHGNVPHGNARIRRHAGTSSAPVAKATTVGDHDDHPLAIPLDALDRGPADHPRRDPEGRHGLVGEATTDRQPLHDLEAAQRAPRGLVEHPAPKPRIVTRPGQLDLDAQDLRGQRVRDDVPDRSSGTSIHRAHDPYLPSRTDRFLTDRGGRGKREERERERGDERQKSSDHETSFGKSGADREIVPPNPKSVAPEVADTVSSTQNRACSEMFRNPRQGAR